MKRSKEVVDDGTILWKKVGGGSFRMPGKIIKPGQKFRARPDQIPAGFRDVVIPLEKIPDGKDIKEEQVPENIPGIQAKYKLNKRPKKDWTKDDNGDEVILYDIVDIAGKTINGKSKPLTKDIAESLINDLHQG